MEIMIDPLLSEVIEEIENKKTQASPAKKCQRVRPIEWVIAWFYREGFDYNMEKGVYEKYSPYIEKGLYVKEEWSILDICRLCGYPVESAHRPVPAAWIEED